MLKKVDVAKKGLDLDEILVFLICFATMKAKWLYDGGIRSQFAIFQ
jgi:hypothetical protein